MPPLHCISVILLELHLHILLPLRWRTSLRCCWQRTDSVIDDSRRDRAPPSVFGRSWGRFLSVTLTFSLSQARVMFISFFFTLLTSCHFYPQLPFQKTNALLVSLRYFDEWRQWLATEHDQQTLFPPFCQSVSFPLTFITSYPDSQLRYLHRSLFEVLLLQWN